MIGPGDLPPRCVPYVVEATRRRSVTLADFFGTRRHYPLVQARQEVWYRMRLEANPPLSYSAIARIFGRDRTTIVHGIGKEATRRGTMIDRRVRRVLPRPEDRPILAALGPPCVVPLWQRALTARGALRSEVA